MAERKNEMWVRTGYFNSRLSRSEGRHVPMEGVLQTIGLRLRSQMKDAKAAVVQAPEKGPKKGNRQQRAQRKSFEQKSGRK